MENTANKPGTRYLLSALIEIYRGSPVILPETDPGLERNLLLDIFSAAISFARLDESRRTLSNEIFRCSREGATVREEMELAATQTPDVTHAKMLAAAHLIEIMERGKFRIS